MTLVAVHPPLHSLTKQHLGPHGQLELQPPDETQQSQNLVAFVPHLVGWGQLIQQPHSQVPLGHV
jgi:hypothetical protein